MKNTLEQIYQDILTDNQNKVLVAKGYLPLYKVNENSQILIIGQAPGIKAQEANETWLDKSGDKLRLWLGVTKDEFYNPDLFGQLPMDFFYPGKGKTGDLPPRAGFAETWHPKILKALKNVKLIVLIGNYSQKHYLKDKYLGNLTETVKNYQEFLPKYFPLPHPSPLNFRWFNNNKWFEEKVLPEFKNMIKNILNKA